MVTDNAYQSMFLVHDRGVVVIDAPHSYSAHLSTAIAQVTQQPITQVVYSHSHIDHIGGTDFIDRVAAKCVNALTPTWPAKLPAFDVYVCDQCYAMEQSLRIE